MPLDPAADPDRFDPARSDEPVSGPLDPDADPDRYQPLTLPGLLGDGAHEDERDKLTWVYGLLGVLGFLLLVTLLAHFGSPR